MHVNSFVHFEIGISYIVNSVFLLVVIVNYPTLVSHKHSDGDFFLWYRGVMIPVSTVGLASCMPLDKSSYQ